MKSFFEIFPLLNRMYLTYPIVCLKGVIKCRENYNLRFKIFMNSALKLSECSFEENHIGKSN